MDTPDRIRKACERIAREMKTRNACLIFCASVEHAYHVAEEMERVSGDACRVVEGNTPPLLREQYLRDFTEGKLRYLANVDICSTGFDAPIIDCIAMLRSTMSPGLYYQMVGRGFRLYEGKNDCLILDFSGNIQRHGPVDSIIINESRGRSKNGEAPVKTCPKCDEVVHASCRECAECGHEFPKPEPKHGIDPAMAAIISDDEWDESVAYIEYAAHQKAGTLPGQHPMTLRVDYYLGVGQKRRSEWVCVEHDGYAGKKALKWWRERTTIEMPDTAEEAAEIGNGGLLREPRVLRMVQKKGSKWPEIVRYEDFEDARCTEEQYRETANREAILSQSLKGYIRETYSEPAPRKEWDPMDDIDDDDIPF